MKMRFLAVCLFAVGGSVPGVLEAATGDLAPLGEAFRILDGTRTGGVLHERAVKGGIPVILGPVSKTDLIATRKGEGRSSEIQTEVRVVVAVNKEPVFQALDLAHELTHAAESRPNPFDPKLDPLSYVKSGIEGAGGEASAIRAECEVGKEILGAAKRFKLGTTTRLLIRARCASVWKASAEPSRWIDSFYQLGHHYWDFLHTLSGLGLDQAKLARWKRRLKARSPLFSSAVTHKPYPLALLEEYIEMTRKVCAHVRSNPSRDPASGARLEGRCEALGLELDP
ncbi:MAG: hypothetical protein EBX52_01770 [Proteobacteria bacterium]|nr:hypothetical protein [Pseudomonadota bacterium]